MTGRRNVDLLMLYKNQMSAVIDTLMGTYRVIAPVMRNDALVYDSVSAPKELVLEYRNTATSPKGVFFPQAERLMAFNRRLDRFNEISEVPLDCTPTLLWGVRPCDARSFLLMDAVFCQGAYRDPYYQARRESTLVVSLTCDRPRRTCFCHAFGSGPYDEEGADILLSEAGDAYIVRAASERGEELLGSLGLGTASSEHLQRAQEIERHAMARLAPVEPVAGVDALLPELFDNPVWQRISEKCLACGTCTYVCPTCHCFNIEDRVLAGGGERLRAWDSCMYPYFTLHASGHNPRPDQAARWRQRAMHKFLYLPQNVGLFGCVGCGRCVQSCPVRLDIRQVLDSVRQASAVLAASKAQEPQ